MRVSLLRTAAAGCGCGAIASYTLHHRALTAPSERSPIIHRPSERTPPPPQQPPRSVYEQLTNPPKFTSDGDRFDMATYAGRALHFLDTLGDLTTLLTTQIELDASQKLLERHAAGDAHGASDGELWRARKLTEAMVHPQSGEVIPAPFRFSAFAPANLIICAGLLRPGASLASSAFWQWANQTYNVAVNYCNRSSGGVDSAQLAGAYCCALVSALGISSGLQLAGARLSGGGARGAQIVRLTVPMLAVSVGGVVNLVVTRGHELSQGVAVFDADDGAPLGDSISAARVALGQCAATRVLWTVALLTVSPLVSGAVLSALAVRGAAARAGVELAAQFAVIWASVPLSIAVFPQHTSLPASAIEPELVAKRPGATRVAFNKGL